MKAVELSIKRDRPVVSLAQASKSLDCFSDTAGLFYRYAKREKVVNATETNFLERGLKETLQCNPAVAMWALLKVYAHQNEHEKMTGRNSECNGQGFTKFDSEILSSLSKQYQRRGLLTPRQMAVLHKCMPKYWRQVVEGLSSAELELVLAGLVPEDLATQAHEDQ